MAKTHWDTIVVGGGVGGLTAAARLVRSGRSVLVLERNPHPGGTAYVYERHGFLFPMGPLGFSHRERIQGFLDALGVGDGFGCDRVRYELRAFGREIPLSLPFPEMTGELTRHFSEEAKGIQQFFQDVERVNGPSDQGGKKEGPPTSMSEYLGALIKDPRLRRLLGSLGTREPYSSFSLQAAMWNLMSQEGIWYPRGGMRGFCGRLVQALAGEAGHPISLQGQKAKGGAGAEGDLQLRHDVKGIRAEGDRVTGVILQDGSELDASSVISNADYKTTFLKLLDATVIPPKWLLAVSRARQAGSIVQVALGVREESVDLSAFEKASRLIYRRNTEDGHGDGADWDQERVDPGRLVGQEIEVTRWSQEDRLLAPAGSGVIVIRTEAPHGHFAKYRPGPRQRAPVYQEYKLGLGRALVAEIERILPGLTHAISVMDVATPLTFEDQGGRSEGAAAGWSWDYEDVRDERPKELVRTPIRGLYMAGYQAFSALFMGGVPTAMESGWRAAQAVLEDADPVENPDLPVGH